MKSRSSAIVDSSFFGMFELTRQCPECLKLASLEHIETRQDPASGELRVFRCACSKETVINHNRPPRAI
jgi:hypothetical protein